MVLPIHYLNIYQRPKQATLAGVFNFLNRYPVYNYQHTIVNQGWFDSASCDLAVQSASEGNDILNNYLGAFVKFFADNPLVPIWEGIINRITFNAGGASYTISLDEMANRISIVYTGAANAAAQVAPANLVGSQAVYGIKQDQIEFGVDPSVGTMRTLLQGTQLAQRAWPQTAITQAQGETNIVHLELIGIFHTLEWEKLFSGTTTTTSVMDTAMGNMVSTLANAATFFDNTDLSQISANAGTISQQSRGMSVWERMLKIAESGDASNYWVCGVMPTDPNTKTRRFYYRLANVAVEYTALQADGLKPRNSLGQLIPPWLVVPDRSIRVEDTLVGFGTTIQADPRVTYIQSVQYDANSQHVQWFGADDTTARAFFQMKKGFKQLSRNVPNTAPQRTIST